MTEKREKPDLVVLLAKIEAAQNIEQLKAAVEDARAAGITIPPHVVYAATEKIVGK